MNDQDQLKNAATEILTADNNLSETLGPSMTQSIRISLRRNDSEIAIERLTHSLFHITAGPSRSCFAPTVSHAVHIFVQAFYAHPIGYNLGSDQAEFESLFHQQLVSPADLKTSLQTRAEMYEQRARDYRTRAEEARSMATTAPTTGQGVKDLLIHEIGKDSDLARQMLEAMPASLIDFNMQENYRAMAENFETTAKQCDQWATESRAWLKEADSPKT
jgi:hypothetical protein